MADESVHSESVSAAVLEFIREHQLAESGQTVLVGFSGGPDSTVLALILKELAENGQIKLKVELAHLNHRLRGEESDQDEQFCREFAHRNHLPIITGEKDVASAQTPGESLEEAARRIRYRFLTATARNRRATVLALGHHADDAAETVLMRLLRGCGLHGLGAIPPRRPSHVAPDITVIRPLLTLRRDQILDYLKNQQQDFRSDSSNIDPTYFRNRVRHEILPHLKKNADHDISRRLARLNSLASSVERELQKRVDTIWTELVRERTDGAVSLDAEKYADLSVSFRTRVIRRGLEAISESPHFLPALTREHFDAAADLVDRPVGKELTLPGGFIARREHGAIYLRREERPALEFRTRLDVPGETIVPDLDVIIKAEILDATDRPAEEFLASDDPWCVHLALDNLRLPLTVRTRDPGDRFRPLNAPGEKKLKDVLIDRKIPHHKRDRIPLVVDDTGRIIWVGGVEVADAVKLTGGEDRILRLIAEDANAPGISR